MHETRYPNEILQIPIFEESDLIRRILFSTRDADDQDPFPYNIAHLTNHTEIRTLAKEEFANLFPDRSQFQSDDDNLSHQREGEKDIFLVPEDLTIPEFVLLLKDIAAQNPDRDAETPNFHNLAQDLMEASTLSSYFASQIARERTSFPEISATDTEDIEKYLRDLSSGLYEISSLMVNPRDLHIPYLQTENPDISHYTDKFAIPADIIPDRLQRISDFIRKDPENSARKTRLFDLYTEMLTHQITSYLHEKMKLELSSAASLTLAQKGSSALISELLPLEVYRAIKYPKFENPDDYQNPEKRQGYIDALLQSEERFLDSLEDQTAETYEAYQTYYLHRDLYQYFSFEYEKELATATTGELTEFLGKRFKYEMKQEGPKFNKTLAITLAREIDLLENHYENSTHAQYQRFQEADAFDLEASLRSFQDEFSNFGFWPEYADYHWSPLGSSPTAILETGEMDCVGRSFTVYGYLKKIGILDEDIISFDIGSHASFFVRNPARHEEIYALDFHPHHDTSLDHTIPIMTMRRIEPKSDRSPQFNTFWDNLFDHPENTNRRLQTNEEFTERLKLYSNTALPTSKPLYLKREQGQLKYIEFDHGLESTTKTLLYHSIQSMKHQRKYQKNKIAQGKESEITEPLIQDEDITAFIDLLKSMSPHNPYYQSLSLDE